MKKNIRNKVLVTIVILAISVGVVFISRHLFFNPNIAHVKKNILNRSRGNPSAKLWVVEYLDFQCRDCASASAWMDEFYKKNSKRMYQQIRFNPLIKNHAYALKSAIYAECVSSQGKFWKYQELLFKNQSEWAESAEPDAILERLAKEAGASVEKLKKCVDNPEIKESVQQEKKDAKALGMKGTPTFFINGEMIFGYEPAKAVLEKYDFEGEKS